MLTGQTAQQRIGNIEDIITGGEGTGDVQLTMRADLQETARQALDGRRGSVVMLDTQTGAVLAMYSNPTYDPNRIVNPDFDAARAALEELLEAPGNPLLANAYQERYMPGSTFKVLTTGIALDAGVDHPRQPVRAAHRVDSRRRRRTRSRTTTARTAAATCARCSAAAATSRSPRRPSTSASRG